MNHSFCFDYANDNYDSLEDGIALFQENGF